MSDEESKLIHEYVTANKLNLSQFIRETVLDKIEEDLQLDEQRILHALKIAENEKNMIILKYGKCWIFNRGI